MQAVILSAQKNTSLGFVRQEVLKKKWLQISETREILQSQTLTATCNRTAIILQQIGHPHFSKESNILKQHITCYHSPPLLAVLSQTAAFVKSSTAFLQLKQWEKKTEGFFCHLVPPTSTNTLWGKMSYSWILNKNICPLRADRAACGMGTGSVQPLYRRTMLFVHSCSFEIKISHGAGY